MVDAQRVQGRQHEKLFEMLNDLHYFSGVRTRDDMKGELQEHTRLLGSIMNLPADRITAQTDHQKRMLQVVVRDSPPMKAKDSKSRANPGFAAYVVDVVLPKVRQEFGTSTRDNVLLITPYAKQKELYHRHFVNLRSQGWTDAELPRLSTVDSSHGLEAHLAILDIVNDEREGFMQDKERCCLAFGRAKEQMIVISGTLARVRHDTTTQVVKDVTDGDKVKTVTLSRPLLHWAKWFVTIDCQFSCVPPEFDIPADLAFFGQAE